MVRAWCIMLMMCGCISGLIAKDTQENNLMTQLEANDVDYDGKKIRLAGAVRIDHSFGELLCHKAVILLKNTPEGKKMVPERILLDGEVEVHLRDGSTLTAGEADLDCSTLEAIFTAQLPVKVVYITSPEDGVKGIPMKASSRAMRVKMKKEGESGSSEYYLSDIQGEDSVTIEYINSLSK